MIAFLKRQWELFYDSFIDQHRYELIIKGLANTLIIALLALLIGLVLGTLIGIVQSFPSDSKGSRTLKHLTGAYVNIFRGTPLIAQLLLIYYVIFASYSGPAIFVAIIVFGLNSAAYVSEIMRAGISSIPKGQMEAGRSMGLSYKMTMEEIILPQAFKNILPALGNEFIALIKETSVAGFVTVMDITQAMRAIVALTNNVYLPYISLAAIYFILVIIFTFLLRKLERRLAQSDRT
jgi:His/Glu/Gln/Arg/opine family amino acid ABC transporter permease subunit